MSCSITTSAADRHDIPIRVAQGVDEAAARWRMTWARRAEVASRPDAAWSGAWVMVGPAIALAALLRGQEERVTPFSTLWAPLTLCALCCVVVAWAMAGSTSPQPPAVMASIEALRGEPWLALGAVALLTLAAVTGDEAPQ